RPQVVRACRRREPSVRRRRWRGRVQVRWRARRQGRRRSCLCRRRQGIRGGNEALGAPGERDEGGRGILGGGEGGGKGGGGLGGGQDGKKAASECPAPEAIADKWEEARPILRRRRARDLYTHPRPQTRETRNAPRKRSVGGGARAGRRVRDRSGNGGQR